MRLKSSPSSSVAYSVTSRNLRSSKSSSSPPFLLDADLCNFPNLASSLPPQRSHHRRIVSKQRKADSFTKTRISARTLSLKNHNQLRRQKFLKLEALDAPQDVGDPSRASACTTIGRKRVVGVDGECGVILTVPATSPPFVCSERSPLPSSNSQCSPRKRFASPTPPSTPTPRLSFTRTTIDQIVECGSGSALEELPFDLLVRIVCCLRHDELKPVLLVCRRLQKAVLIARQCHFNFTTPGREKKEKLGLFVPHDNEWLPEGGSEDLETLVHPPTPKAPRQPPKPAHARLSITDIRPIAPRLYQEPAYITSNCRKSLRLLPRPMGRGAVSLRVLFYEEELCEKVARNAI